MNAEQSKQIEALYLEMFDLLIHYARSALKNESLAEEVTQETFFKAIKNIDKFEGRSTLYVWLCQIAKNTFYTHYQKSKRFVAIEEGLLKTSDGFEESFLNQETAFEIHKVLHTLEEPYKEVFSLRVFSELSFRQIGELFNKTESWARVTYHRAKLKIQEEML